MIKVLYVDHAEELGGAEQSLLALLRQLQTSVEPLVACNAGRVQDSARELGIEVFQVSMPQLRHRAEAPFELWKCARLLSAVAQSEAVDLIHSNTMRAGLYASTAALLCRRPLVWHARDSFPEAWYRRWMCRAATQVIAVSRFIAHQLPCKRKTRVIPNGVDLDVFKPLAGDSSYRKQIGVPAGAPLIGCVGRLRKWKGQEHFLHAAALISEALPEVHFAIIGGQIFSDEKDDYPDELRKISSELGLEDRVHFPGHVEDMVPVYDSLDLLLHTSENEPFGRVLIESMAMEIPVVGFASGAATEILNEGVTGFLVPPGCVSEMARRALELLREPGIARQMGMNGRRHVRSHFEIGRTARLVVETYREILEGRE